MVQYQAMTNELSHICVSQQYRCHMIIEVEWGDLRRTFSTRDVVTSFAYLFKLDLD